MGFFKNIVNLIAKASIPTYKFEENSLIFKLNNDQFFTYDLGEYEIKTRHDSYVLEAYTLKNDDIFLEYIRTHNNASWNGQPLSLFEGFFKIKLNIKSFKLLEEKEINKYTFKVFKVDDSFVLHIIYIYTAVSDIIIVDMKGELYKNLLTRLDESYKYKFNDEKKGFVNFNISMIKENYIQNFIEGEK